MRASSGQRYPCDNWLENSHMRLSKLYTAMSFLCAFLASAAAAQPAAPQTEPPQLEIRERAPPSQRVLPLTDENRRRLEAQRTWVRGHFSDDAEAKYANLKAKLFLINHILEQGWVKKEETVKLQSLGTNLGDAFAQDLGMHWVTVEEGGQQDPALSFGDDSILIYPITMISKRIESGEKVDVYALFVEVVILIKEQLEDRKADEQKSRSR